MDNQREKLIELIVNAKPYDSYECTICTKDDVACECCGAEKLADYLLANGIIVPPCKVGDKVYEWDYDFETDTDYVIESHVCGFAIMTEMGIYPLRNFGKTVFPSKEDAEKALQGVE